MKYTFYYKRIELGRMEVQCVEIPEFKTELLDRDSNAEEVLWILWRALNLFIPIALLIGQKISLPACKYDGEGFFKVDLTEENQKKLLEAQNG